MATLLDRDLTPGQYRITVNASTLSSGIYFYRMTAKSYQSESPPFVAEKKMVVLK